MIQDRTPFNVTRELAVSGRDKVTVRAYPDSSAGLSFLYKSCISSPVML